MQGVRRTESRSADSAEPAMEPSGELPTPLTRSNDERVVQDNQPARAGSTVLTPVCGLPRGGSRLGPTRKSPPGIARGAMAAESDPLLGGHERSRSLEEPRPTQNAAGAGQRSGDHRTMCRIAAPVGPGRICRWPVRFCSGRFGNRVSAGCRSPPSGGWSAGLQRTRRRAASATPRWFDGVLGVCCPSE